MQDMHRVKAVRAVLLCLAALAVHTSPAFPGETDQFLVWGVELEDSAPAINRYINEQAARYLETYNRECNGPGDPVDVSNGVFRHLFRGIHASKLRNWLQHSDEIDRFPPKSVSFWEYQNMSIYRGRSFPYILPMSRTVRVGDVYFGIDKFSHFFGFGRRSYNRYLTLRDRGLSEEEALDGVIRRSIWWENTFVGKLVDGIFSHADIEASFQGMRLARDLCKGEQPYIAYADGEWKLVRKIDLRDYITPDFDESYNPCHYWALRKRFVLPLLASEYRDRLASPQVSDRFAKYRRHEASLSVRMIRERFEGWGNDFQYGQYRDAFGVAPRQLASRSE